ncbi:MAG: ribonuclease P protein component [Deltaproteobacteria bacterium]|nr:MAG: ribonuclease P protein component [Deltaproteobacteria bacterium]
MEHPRETFKKKERISKRSDFIRRHPEDVVVHTPEYQFVFKPTSLGFSRLGIVVTRKHGNAVFRNRVKRVLREAFRKNKMLIQPPRDVIAIRKHRPTKPTFREAERHFTDAARKLTYLQQRKNHSTK